MIELARYRQRSANVVVSRDGDDLGFRSCYHHHRAAIAEECCVTVVPR